MPRTPWPHPPCGGPRSTFNLTRFWGSEGLLGWEHASGHLRQDHPASPLGKKTSTELNARGVVIIMTSKN